MIRAGIIEARMGSSRLPGKVMKPLAGRPLIEHVVRRAQACRTLHRVVLATTTDPRDDVLEEQATRLGCACHRGSESDVLTRVLDAARSVDADIIVKLSGDNPLYHPEYVDPIVEAFGEHCDFLSNTAMGFSRAWAKERRWPVGTGVMVFRTSTLAASLAEDNLTEADREHVIRHIIESPAKYRLASFDPDGPFSGFDRPSYRFCIDTSEDYAFFQAIFDRLSPADPMFGLSAVIALVEREPELLEIIRDVRQRAI